MAWLTTNERYASVPYRVSLPASFSEYLNPELAPGSVNANSGASSHMNTKR